MAEFKSPETSYSLASARRRWRRRGRPGVQSLSVVYSVGYESVHIHVQDAEALAPQLFSGHWGRFSTAFFTVSAEASGSSWLQESAATKIRL